MYSIVKTEAFDKWFRKLKDRRAKAKILFRIQRIEENGNFGDCEPVGQGFSELRIHYAKGYRIYFKEYRGTVIVLLSGGTKSSQQKDIDRAREIWSSIKDELTDDD
ncbi:MAG: type II toxin-antitoxin system RelE/ParE family toxin [Cyclobacteriaceae bacterium]